MDKAIFDIDHIMLSVGDNASAADTFSRMGFTTTPRGQLPGLSNRLICFGGGRRNSPNFIELMSLEDAELAPPAMVQALSGPDRPVLMVMATESAEKTRSELSDAGLDVSPVIDGERNWTLPSGEVLDLEFSIVLPSVGQAPFYWIACQHKTPQHYLRQDFVEHKNGGLLLKKVIAISENPQEAANHFATNWAAAVSEREDQNAPVVVTRGVVELHIFDRENYSNHYPGVEIARNEDHIAGISVSVRSISNLEDLLKDNGFEPLKPGSAIVLPPSQACGCLVVFEENKLDISQLNLGPLPI